MRPVPHRWRTRVRSGVIGPNLDDAFRQSRADGLGERTIQSVVRGQISYPVENPPTGLPGMPADIVTGDDAESVAAYVASVAALPVRAEPGAEAGGGEEGGAVDGKAIFAEAGCGSCHTLAAADAAGNDRPEPRRDEAVEGARDRSRHERHGRDAPVQGRLLGGADRSGRRLRPDNAGK